MTIPFTENLDVQFDEVCAAQDESVCWIDLREAGEKMLEPVSTPEMLDLPMSVLVPQDFEVDSQKQYVFVCAHGVRSQMVANAFRELGHKNVYSLVGGTAGMPRLSGGEIGE